ncbi:MAG: copper-binding protein [Aquabacterium sp.]|uniref:copper-binding protein n=1 Tax=Aquabacterium sp. TaxID=1872578 RepID=UPI003BC89471
MIQHLLWTFVLATCATLAHAQTAEAPHDHGGEATHDHAAHELADGEVRKIDLAQGKLTLRHGPIASIDMPPMTMVYKVAQPAWLKGLKVGDHIRFQAAQIKGAYVVTQIEPAH